MSLSDQLDAQMRAQLRRGRPLPPLMPAAPLSPLAKPRQHRRPPTTVFRQVSLRLT